MSDDRDPICDHYDAAVGFMSYPPIYELVGASGGCASTHVCGRTECRDDARDWVRDITGHDGVFVSFAENRERLAGQMTLVEVVS